MPKFVFMPPQDDLRLWFATRLGDTLSEYEVASPETDEGAIEAIATADAAMGWVPSPALDVAQRRQVAAQPRCGALLRVLLPRAS